MRRDGSFYSWSWRSSDPGGYGLAGWIVRFLITIGALWLGQWLVAGFDIDGAGALIFGGVIVTIVNTIVRPVVMFVTCLLTIVTFGLFILIINTAMLGLTAWIAGWFDLAFEVDGFIAAFLGALVVSVVTTIVNSWASRNLLGRRQRAW